jgi:hypothetical protein
MKLKLKVRVQRVRIKKEWVGDPGSEEPSDDVMIYDDAPRIDK